MKHWQLSLLLYAALAASPFVFHAIGTAGASSALAAHCRTIPTDKAVLSACRDLGLY